MKIYAVLDEDKRPVVAFDPDTGRQFPLITLLPEQKVLLEEAQESLRKEVGVETTLEEFDIEPPYGVCSGIAQTGEAEKMDLKPHPLCICRDAMAAMFCPYGHMLECHYPLDCQTAQCSHLSRY